MVTRHESKSELAMNVGKIATKKIDEIKKNKEWRHWFTYQNKGTGSLLFDKNLDKIKNSAKWTKKWKWGVCYTNIPSHYYVSFEKWWFDWAKTTQYRFLFLRLNAPFLLFETHCMLTFYTLQNSGRTKQQFPLMTKCHANYFVKSEILPRALWHSHEINGA